MARPPRILIPGLASKRGVQAGAQGVLIGRVSGFGPLQLLNGQQQRAMGVRSPSNNQQAKQAGFTFSVEGLPGAHQFIGRGVWSLPITFHSSDPNDVVTAISGATGTPSFTMVSDTNVQLGTIQFTAPKVAVVTWASDPYIHPAGAGLTLYAPAIQDATLGGISGRVVGYI